MKKSSFLEGAIIATIGVVLCKIIGLVYVIPFYAIIGKEGGTLYSYAYSIYAIFLSLSTSGIPIAISKIVSEYNALGYYKTKEKAFKIGSKLLILTGFLCFIVLMIFAEKIAYLIIGNTDGGTSISQVAFVIRIVSTALLIVPSLSVTKGYLQGHKIMKPSSVANVLEQLVRVIVILLGSYLTLKVFNLSIETGVGISVFAATVGAISAYFYLVFKIKRNKENLNITDKESNEEKNISSKDVLKKIITYAIPFIVIDLINSAYGMIDVFSVVRTMTNLGYDKIDSEVALSVMATWGSKLNMIVIPIAVGITTSLIPNIASSFAKKDLKDVNGKINQAFESLIFIALPMTLGLSFLAKEVWVVFYGYDLLSINVFRLYVLLSLSYCLFTISVNITQTLNHTKLALGTLIGSFLVKAIINVPVMHLFKMIGLEVYYAPVAVTMFTQLGSTLFIRYMLKRKFNFEFKKSNINIFKILLCSLIMIGSLFIFKQFVDLGTHDRMINLLSCVIYAVIGGLIYFILVYKTKLFEKIIGNNLLNKFKKK